MQASITKTHTEMFMASLFIPAPEWKQPRRLWRGEGVKCGLCVQWKSTQAQKPVCCYHSAGSLNNMLSERRWPQQGPSTWFHFWEVQEHSRLFCVWSQQSCPLCKEMPLCWFLTCPWILWHSSHQKLDCNHFLLEDAAETRPKLVIWPPVGHLEGLTLRSKPPCWEEAMWPQRSSMRR